jgi:FkbM family methyltransferase
MTSIKKITKRSLGAVGLLSPVQGVWYWHLRRKVRRDLAQLYRHFIGPGDLCFDIGANIGEVAQVMLELGARVISVEPQSDTKFVPVPKAVGSQSGTGKLLVCEKSVCTTMSPDYVAAVTQSGRLPSDEFHWTEEREVPVTTVDELIQTYGVPAFLKIDVEGLEAEVIRGCSQKLNLVSLEFTPERLQPALDCVAMLEKLGEVEFNYAVESEWKLRLPGWVTGRELATELKNGHFRIVTSPAGDLYARFK